MDETDDAKRHRKGRRAAARGEGIRAELLELLSDGPRTAADLFPLVKTDNASLSEIAFQLERLTAERQTVGEQGGAYMLA